MHVFLGLDLGTTNCKVVAVDHQGQVVANASAPTPVLSSPDLDITEYDAEMLWTVIARLVRQVIEKPGPEQKVSGLLDHLLFDRPIYHQLQYGFSKAFDHGNERLLQALKFGVGDSLATTISNPGSL
jgi:hypothetical protein